MLVGGSDSLSEVGKGFGARATEICDEPCVIGVWCNGSTTDSGSVSSGSSPDTPTKIYYKADG